MLKHICRCILHPLHCHFISPKMSFCWPVRYCCRPFPHTMNSLGWLSNSLMSCHEVVTIMELRLTSALWSHQSSYTSVIFQSTYISTTFGKENIPFPSVVSLSFLRLLYNCAQVIDYNTHTHSHKHNHTSTLQSTYSKTHAHWQELICIK